MASTRQEKWRRSAACKAWAKFECVDASQPLPIPNASFDAVISIDAMNHLSRRAEVFAEWLRVLRPGGRFLFTDAVIVTGMLSRDEILARSRSMGHFLFTPTGLYERLIEVAGFVELQVEDVTEIIATVSKRWHDAREKHRSELLKIETQADRACKHARRRALWPASAASRFAYSATRQARRVFLRRWRISSRPSGLPSRNSHLGGRPGSSVLVWSRSKVWPAAGMPSSARELAEWRTGPRPNTTRFSSTFRQTRISISLRCGRLRARHAVEISPRSIAIRARGSPRLAEAASVLTPENLSSTSRLADVIVGFGRDSAEQKLVTALRLL